MLHTNLIITYITKKINNFSKIYNYWDGTLLIDASGEKLEMNVRGVIYTDKEDRGGIATCKDSLDIDYIKSVVEIQKNPEDINEGGLYKQELLDFSRAAYDIMLDNSDDGTNQSSASSTSTFVTSNGVFPNLPNCFLRFSVCGVRANSF